MPVKIMNENRAKEKKKKEGITCYRIEKDKKEG